MNKDWTGNKNSIFKTLSATSHGQNERQESDFYATDPIAMELLLNIEKFSPNIWEPACGAGHLSKVLESHGYNVKSTDYYDRGYGQGGVDFLWPDIKEWNGDIITNPPYRFAEDFLEKALSIIPVGNKVAMFLKIQFLEGKARKELYKKYPLKILYVSSSRIQCAINGDFNINGSAVAYCWFIWEKGYTGDTIIKWFN
jgi:hypothetical protein